MALPTPPFDPKRYQDKQSNDDTSVSSYHSRLRNRSRGGSVSRSRDIVQDVYDRMGVNYVRGRPSIEALLQDKDTGDSAKPTSTPGNLSARNVAQWPPVSTPRSSENEEKASTHSRTFSLPPAGPKDRNDRKSMPPVTSRSFSRKHMADQRDEDSKTVDFQAPDDERDAISLVSAKSSKSVRDRISIYGSSIRASMGGSARANVRHSYGGTSNKRHYPPKVNLYDNPSVGNKGVKDGADASVDASQGVDQTSCIGGTRNRLSAGANSASQRSVGEAFLSAISKPNNESSSPRHISRNIVVVEIPNNNDQQGNDNGSAASSVSGDDFLTSPRQRGGKYANKANSTSIEKQIDERVHAQIAALTRKFDADIRRVENRIDQECKARIEELEKRNEELMVLLSKAGNPM